MKNAILLNAQQSKLGSLIESLANTAIGYLVALSSQLIIFPMFGVYLPLSDNLLIGAWFTLVSIARSYILRRYFNARLHAACMKIASKH